MVMATAPADRGDRRPLLLLVEDHVDTRQMYAEYLGSAFRVLEAGDGQEALEMMRAQPPDILVTDLSLPRVDGFELIARVRADQAMRAMPIICLSGYGGQSHDARARAAGSDRVIQKPCMPDALSEAASQLLRQSRTDNA
jgi:CheY-like chemotaxis protein